MNFKFGAYLIVPFKYSHLLDMPVIDGEGIERYPITTMDINENIKQMFHDNCGYTVGTVYKIAPKMMLSPLIRSLDYHHFTVSEGGQSGHFNILDSYLYIFNTKIAFLCVGISFEEMSVLERICNPGYAINPAVFSVCCKDGSAYDFSIDEWLLNICKPWKLERFYNNHSSMLLESYTYILGLSDTFFPSLESLRMMTFNLHQMHDPETTFEDNSEDDIRYAYAVKNMSRMGYRWGCCVTSQTTAYVVADADKEPDLIDEMNTQAADGLPITLLALYEKYTCLRFTELISNLPKQKIKSILELKRTLLNFQALGTVTPANLSRWNNVRQIYGFLLEVFDIDTAVHDISSKIEILVAQQQELESLRTSRIMNLITVFGVVGIMASVQEIVQILSDGSNLMWNVTVLTSAILALCFGLAMRKK